MTKLSAVKTEPNTTNIHQKIRDTIKQTKKSTVQNPRWLWPILTITLTLGSVHAENLPWTIISTDFGDSSSWLVLSFQSMNTHTCTHARTHTHTRTHRERERERDRQMPLNAISTLLATAGVNE